MKLQPDRFDVPSVNAYGPGWIAVNGERHERSFMLSSQHGVKEWPCARFEDLSVAHFEQLAALGAEIVLLGSGRTLRFPKPEWLQLWWRRKRASRPWTPTPLAGPTTSWREKVGRSR